MQIIGNYSVEFDSSNADKDLYISHPSTINNYELDNLILSARIDAGSLCLFDSKNETLLKYLGFPGELVSMAQNFYVVDLDEFGKPKLAIKIEFDT